MWTFTLFLFSHSATHLSQNCLEFNFYKHEEKKLEKIQRFSAKLVSEQRVLRHKTNSAGREDNGKHGHDKNIQGTGLRR